MLFRSVDVTVISFFDGRRWQIETFFHLAEARDAEYKEVGTLDKLRPATRAYLRLLENLMGEFDALPPIGGPHACVLIDYFGDQEKVPEAYRAYNGTTPASRPSASTTRPADLMSHLVYGETK